MATQPARDPLEAETEAVYAANPGLREELHEMERLLEREELETVDSSRIGLALSRRSAVP